MWQHRVATGHNHVGRCWRSVRLLDGTVFRMISSLTKLGQVYDLFLEFLKGRHWARLKKIGEVCDNLFAFLQDRPGMRLTADVIKLAFRRLYRNKRRYWSALIASAL